MTNATTNAELADELEALAREVASDHQHTRAVGYQGIVLRIPAILLALRGDGKLREALADYDRAILDCPLNSPRPHEVQASKIVCQRCGADRGGSCGVDAGATRNFIRRARSALNGETT